MSDKSHEPRPLGVVGQLEKLCEIICNDYCKYSPIMAELPEDGGELFEQFCRDCPVVRLLQ